MNRSGKQWHKLIGQDIEDPLPAKRYISMQLLNACEAIDFISSRYMPFDHSDVIKEIEVSDTTAKRWLRTFEIVGWIEQLPAVNDGKLGREKNRYKTLKRIQCPK